jgi:hypothetical protein
MIRAFSTAAFSYPFRDGSLLAMKYSANEVLQILIERLSRDISTVESQIKQRQVDKPSAVPPLEAVRTSLLETRLVTEQSLAAIPAD